MIKLLSKFGISNRLLEADGVPTARPTPNPSSTELHEFESSLRELDRRLRVPPPVDRQPPGLHQSIMQAVRSASTAAKNEPIGVPIRGPVWALGLATITLVACWWAFRPTRQSESTNLAAAENFREAGTTATRLSQQMAGQFPAATFRPLATELELVSRDLQTATQTLLACLPGEMGQPREF